MLSLKKLLSLAELQLDNFNVPRNRGVFFGLATLRGEYASESAQLNQRNERGQPA